MQISNLPASGSFSGTDVLAIEVNGITYRLTGATLAAALKTMGNYLTTANLYNALDQTEAGYALDARQGAYIMAHPDELIWAEVDALKSAAYRNAIPRGKNLGTFTGTMSDCINAGDFKGLAIGDTFKYSSRTHTIAHFDLNIACGDNISLGHNIAVVSDGGWSSQWNTSNTTAGGYVGSAIRAYIKSSGGPQEQIIGDFGSGHVLSYRALYPSTYDSNGNATGWAWVDARSELLNETQVYGHQVWGQNGYEDGIDKFQLAIFRLMPSFMNTRAYWWLRSVYSAAYACVVSDAGDAYYNGASYSRGVRPLSLIA